MTILLSEKDVEALLSMDEVVSAVELAFKREGLGQAQNFMRTRTRGSSSVLSVMHASASYIWRGGLKAYMSSAAGTKFLVVLFDGKNSSPLAVMGADILGRYRTGAASGVATKHLYRKKSGKVALFGSGRQALTQALALASVIKVQEFRVYSPTRGHREAFVSVLKEKGMEASAFESAGEAARGADVMSTITSSKEPFLDVQELTTVSHANLCGGNVPEHAEITPAALHAFDTVVVDDLPQARAEYGDLIQAAKAGAFEWESAVELGDVLAEKHKPRGRTLFKSGGAALEDVAVANLVYEKARSLGYEEFQFH